MPTLPHSIQPPLRLLQILGGAEVPGQGVTGVERVVQTLIQNLDPERFEHYLVYPETGELVQNLRGRIRANMGCLPRRRVDRSWMRDLSAFIQTHTVHLVLTHAWRVDFLTALTCRPLRRPHVVARAAPLADEATLGPWRKLLYGVVDTWTLHRCAGIVTVSETSRLRMGLTQGLAARQITVISNGVDVPPLGPGKREAARRRLHSGPEDLVIGAAGRLVPGKGFDVLLKAVAHLQERHPSCKPRVVILGEGPERDHLEQDASARGLELHLPGFVPDPYDWMAAFDIAVLPSRAEGMPLAVLETMGLGIATVATDVGGCREILRDGETGCLVRVGDAAALADALERLLDPATRERFGTAAAREVKGKYSVQAMVQAYDTFLTQTAARWSGL